LVRLSATTSVASGCRGWGRFRAASALCRSMRPTAHVYVDGFNLYNGLKRRGKEKGVPGIEYRWLDLVKLARTLLPHAEVERVYYFTSRVKRRLGDPGAADRQEIFIRALERMSQIEVVRGSFRRVRVFGEVVGDPSRTEAVSTYREKRSDVNLATYLLRDAFDKNSQLAAVVSGDSDLVAPIALAHKKFPHGVVVLNPNISGSHELAKVAQEILIPESAFRYSQLPLAVRDKEGRETRRPDQW
jgi:uncharacterized LabA/DUF88 family protein